MKRLMVALLATSTMALAVPAFAHDHSEQPGASADEQWNNGGASYGDFSQEYQRIWDGIQHGVGDGSYTQSQGQQFFRAMQDIKARAEDMERNGRYDPQDTQARLQQLNNVMRNAHERGHAIMDRGGQVGGDQWNNGGATYADFNQEYQHISQGIQHGLSDGSYSRSQARGFYRAMQRIKARADWMERSGRYDPQDTQARLERLHEAMHAAHERGHQLLDRYGDNR